MPDRRSYEITPEVAGKMILAESVAQGWMPAEPSAETLAAIARIVRGAMRESDGSRIDPRTGRVLCTP